jgi:hypothetical protein
MKRVFITSLVALVFGSLWQGFALSLPPVLNAFFMAPVVMVFALQYFKPLEALAISLTVGTIVDVLGGTWVGINILLMLGFMFVLGAMNVFSGRMPKYNLWVYLVGISFAYRVAFSLMQFICFGTEANFYFWQLIIGPLLDAALSQIFFYLLAKILIWVKGLDQHDYFRAALGSRR